MFVTIGRTKNASQPSAAGVIGSGLTATGTIQGGKNYWLGTNGKYYNTFWGGNQWTDGRNTILHSSRAIKATGSLLGVPSVMYNFSNTIDAFNNGNYSGARIGLAETGSAGISAFGGIPDIGWSIGWESGWYS